MKYSVVVIPKDEVKVSLWSKLNVQTQFHSDSFDVAQQMLAILADIYQMPKPEWSDVPCELVHENEDLLIKIVEEEKL
jgi:hypothetical protein